jgi:hypothetical protein
MISSNIIKESHLSQCLALPHIQSVIRIKLTFFCILNPHGKVFSFSGNTLHTVVNEIKMSG